MPVVRAIPFEYTWGGGGGGVERSPIKKSWGEGGQDKKKIIGRGVCQILKNMGRGGGLPGKKNNIGCGVSRRSGAKTLP